MTREEVYAMPPADRENIIRLVSVLPRGVRGGCLDFYFVQRTTLGLPT